MGGKVAREPEPAPHRLRYVLSCGHDRYCFSDELPSLGDLVYCRTCEVDATVIAVDERELALWCPECNKTIRFFGRLATLTAGSAKAKHNIRDKRGHHAIVRETGNYVTRANDIDS